MSAHGTRHIGISTKIECVESEVIVELGTNRVTGTYVYVTPREGWVATLPVAGASHPDFPGLYLIKVRGQRIEGDLQKVVCEYESSAATANYPGRPAGGVTRYALRLSTSEEPLLSHPKLRDISDEEKYILTQIQSGSLELKEMKKLAEKITSGPGQEALAMVMKGISGYLAPSVTWVKRYNASSPPGLNGLGKKANPSGAPSAAGYDYIYVGGSGEMTEDGKAYDNEQQWLLTADGGANDFLYT